MLGLYFLLREYAPIWIRKGMNGDVEVAPTANHARLRKVRG